MAMHTLDGLVERVALHTELTADDARALRDLPFTTTRRDQHTYITREGETVEHCYVVLSGLVERHRLESDGGKQILAWEVRARRGEPGGDGPGLPVSQYNIAEATGLTPVHVNRTLKMMQAKGLLTANRSGIRVHRWDDLRENSGFHYRYLHMLTLRDHS